MTKTDKMREDFTAIIKKYHKKVTWWKDLIIVNFLLVIAFALCMIFTIFTGAVAALILGIACLSLSWGINLYFLVYIKKEVFQYLKEVNEKYADHLGNKLWKEDEVLVGYSKRNFYIWIGAFAISFLLPLTFPVFLFAGLGSAKDAIKHITKK